MMFRVLSHNGRLHEWWLSRDLITCKGLSVHEVLHKCTQMQCNSYDDFILTQKNWFSLTEAIKRCIKAVSLSQQGLNQFLWVDPVWKINEALLQHIQPHWGIFHDLRGVKGFQGDSCVGNMVWLEPCDCQEGSGAEAWSCLFLEHNLATTCCARVAQSLHIYKHSHTHLQTATAGAVSKKREKSGVYFHHAGIHLYCCSIQQLLAF